VYLTFDPVQLGGGGTLQSMDKGVPGEWCLFAVTSP
jgi:hypothetical protein